MKKRNEHGFNKTLLTQIGSRPAGHSFADPRFRSLYYRYSQNTICENPIALLYWGDVRGWPHLNIFEIRTFWETEDTTTSCVKKEGAM